MKFTTSNPYRILKTVLGYNTLGIYPQLSDIVAMLGYTTKLTISVALTQLKKDGLIGVNGSRRLYRYFVTSAGIDKIKQYEYFEDTSMLKTLLRLQTFGD